jgi:uncharacterized protein
LPDSPTDGQLPEVSKGSRMIDAVLDRLELVLRRHGRIAIAVSGGGDSMTLAHVAAQTVDAVMVHAVSPAVPADATARVKRHAERHGWSLVVTDAGEFADGRYVANPVDRCYFCKSNLYARIADHTERTIASGANLDDLGDYRPGLVAARERRVVHPLVEAGIDKSGVRAIAATLGLGDLAELPAQPCLASRIETGIAIDAADLVFVNHVEDLIRAIAPDLADIRCRITRRGVVVEADEPPSERLDAIERLAAVATREAGRVFAGVAPYRKGSAFIGAKQNTLSAP